MSEKQGCWCHRCRERYMIDLMIPNELWKKINIYPKRWELLCPKCIMTLIAQRTGFAAFRLVEIDEYTQLIVERRAREKAEEHCRNHHLEPCETCMATESELIALRARLSALESMLDDAMGLLHNHEQHKDPGWRKDYEKLNSQYDKILNTGKCEEKQT